MFSLSLFVRLSVHLSPFFSLVSFEVCSTFERSLLIKSVIRIQLESMSFSRMFQGCFQEVSRVFQGSLKGTERKF